MSTENVNTPPTHDSGTVPGVGSSDWLAKTPRMADGTPILLGDEVWFAQDGYDDWPWTRATKGRVTMLSLGQGFPCYNGGYTVVADGDWEGGNLDCYRTAEEVPGVDR